MRARLQGFTIVELLVVISITAVLIAILLPSLQKSRNLTQTLKCSSNLRQLGVADETYRIDYNRWFVAIGSYVPDLADYTGTPPETYTWVGYGTSFRRYLQAHPFKCPLVQMGTQFEGPYNQAVMNMTSGGVSDFSLNTALHLDTVTNNQYITRKRDTQLVHSPAEVANYQDARGGGTRFDYSTFAAEFRHNELNTMNMVFVDGHGVSQRMTGSVTTFSQFSRGANNTTYYVDRPYFWW